MTIDITSVLSQNLNSRSIVHDLLLFIQNSGEKDVILDFSNVTFVTRSFMDEFFIVFLKNGVKGIDIQLTGLSDDFTAILNAVKHPKRVNKAFFSHTSVVTFKNVDQMKECFKNLQF